VNPEAAPASFHPDPIFALLIGIWVVAPTLGLSSPLLLFRVQAPYEDEGPV
jgi:hypothetical protein